MGFNTAQSPVPVPTVTLSDGNSIPALGFGVWQVPDDESYGAVTEALKAGYRSIDTARIYENEAGVGRALADSGIARDELFVTTKLWNDDQGYDSTLRAFDASLGRLGLDFVDLYLIHWPVPSADRYVETFKAFQKIKAEGRARSIGVSNFTPATLERLIAETGEVPVLNLDSTKPSCGLSTPERESRPKRGAPSGREPSSRTSRSPPSRRHTVSRQRR
jgi:2,5-diketo-D-gluconate reductase A